MNVPDSIAPEENKNLNASTRVADTLSPVLEIGVVRPLVSTNRPLNETPVNVASEGRINVRIPDTPFSLVADPTPAVILIDVLAAVTEAAVGVAPTV